MARYTYKFKIGAIVKLTRRIDCRSNGGPLMLIGTEFTIRKRCRNFSCWAKHPEFGTRRLSNDDLKFVAKGAP